MLIKLTTLDLISTRLVSVRAWSVSGVLTIRLGGGAASCCGVSVGSCGAPAGACLMTGAGAGSALAINALAATMAAATNFAKYMIPSPNEWIDSPSPRLAPAPVER